MAQANGGGVGFAEPTLAERRASESARAAYLAIWLTRNVQAGGGGGLPQGQVRAYR